MPVQITDTTSSIQYTAANQAWIIAPGVNVGSGVFSDQTGSTLVNYGHVLYTVQAVQFLASDAFLHNTADGLISGLNGILTNADLMEIRNEGRIDGFSGAGILGFGLTNHLTIENSGIVTGRDEGISLTGFATLVVSIANSGTINGDVGIRMGFASGAQPVIVNSGTIKGNVHAILSETDDRLNVTNTGKLIGHVTAADEILVDSVVNNGTITGNVNLQLGNDVYKGVGTVSGWVYGGDGIDKLSGGNAVDRFDGGNGNDVLTGNGGGDVLRGGAGVDILFGGLGNDVLTGGANTDYFVFNTAPNSTVNRDAIVDFSHVDDAFRLENAIFTRLGTPGLLLPAFFRNGAAAADANDFIIYNRATGALLYDSNANATGGMVLLATLSNKPGLASNYFVVI
jgi:Ca2+-binding RTX toxin-like protein